MGGPLRPRAAHRRAPVWAVACHAGRPRSIAKFPAAIGGAGSALGVVPVILPGESLSPFRTFPASTEHSSARISTTEHMRALQRLGFLHSFRSPAAQASNLVDRDASDR